MKPPSNLNAVGRLPSVSFRTTGTFSAVLLSRDERPQKVSSPEHATERPRSQRHQNRLLPAIHHTLFPQTMHLHGPPSLSDIHGISV
jgi:hypothetical protein